MFSVDFLLEEQGLLENLFPYLQIKLFSEPGIDGKLDSIFKVKHKMKGDYHHHFFFNSNIFQTISSFVFNMCFGLNATI